MDGGVGGSQGFNGLQFSDSEFVMSIDEETLNHNDPTASSNNVPNVIIREKEHFMPIFNITNIMRKALPYYANISEDSKEAVQECVSEFIGFITSEANDHCKQEQRKTITAEDLLLAMHKLGFYTYFDLLNLFLSRYRKAKDIERGVVRNDAFMVNNPQSNLIGPGVTYSSGVTSLSPLVPVAEQPLHMGPIDGYDEMYGAGIRGNLVGMLNSNIGSNNVSGWVDNVSEESSYYYMNNFNDYGGYK